jgi:hypothetical protein
MSADHPQRGGPCGIRQQPAGGQDRVEDRQAQRGQDRCGAEIALNSGDDRRKTDELARRVQVEELVDEVRRTLDGREPLGQLAADGRATHVGGRPREVVGIQRSLALLATATLIATDRAAIAFRDRFGATGLGRLPHDLVDDQ